MGSNRMEQIYKYNYENNIGNSTQHIVIMRVCCSNVYHHPYSCILSDAPQKHLIPLHAAHITITGNREALIVHVVLGDFVSGI